jgi:hypothetical protein
MPGGSGIPDRLEGLSIKMSICMNHFRRGRHVELCWSKCWGEKGMEVGEAARLAEESSLRPHTCMKKQVTLGRNTSTVSGALCAFLVSLIRTLFTSSSQGGKKGERKKNILLKHQSSGAGS